MSPAAEALTGSLETIPHEVAEQIGYYVYALRDPRNGKVFYVGKGVGDRINAHQREAGKNPESERAKLRMINEIQSTGHDVELLFLRTEVPTEEAAYMVEQAVIDAFAANNDQLTNLVKGHQSGDQGLASVNAVIARYAALPTPAIPHPLLMVKINRGWRPDMNNSDIYEQTRGHWKVGADVRHRAVYALGVAFGVVRGVYRINSWFPSEQPGESGRWGFTGESAAELEGIIGTHVRDLVKQGNQNPIQKFLDGYAGYSEIRRD